MTDDTLMQAIQEIRARGLLGDDAVDEMLSQLARTNEHWDAQYRRLGTIETQLARLTRTVHPSEFARWLRSREAPAVTQLMAHDLPAQLAWLTRLLDAYTQTTPDETVFAALLEDGENVP